MDMEVAGQWRREWAGTAEYGKVTEGGVTRRVARALEVLHASAPGARVRVMRAAYHSSAGPGVPAASYMVHSSRRVFSSGANFLESPSSPAKPLEISSTPLESLPIETENYKVTEPDDTDISEPSKWRVSTGRSSLRMPSEESSSTADNASIVDLDIKNNYVFRKSSYDSENSDIHIPRSSARSSPLLDTSATLSTLKYKSLLNSSNDWNNRRKSYSFEDTSPLNETILHANDTLAMESSTDSGICKSNEIVNDYIGENTYTQYLERHDQKQTYQKETFKGWLSKNRANNVFKGAELRNYRKSQNDIKVPEESNITLQSTGKVSITLPVTVDEDYQYKKIDTIDDGDRKIKKVEFCKTELHFAADSGTVNIIETDEKPPPSNDFRKRRSAFIPLKDKYEKPITLFGEKINNFTETSEFQGFLMSDKSETTDSDENTAATKSILKNKIPKPKPYLLGENMEFGTSVEQSSKISLDNDPSVPTAVSLINKQLQADKKHNNEIMGIDPVTSTVKSNASRSIETGPIKRNGARERTIPVEVEKDRIDIKKDICGNNSVKHKLNVLKMSPVQGRPKTRELRESDLPYFGINNGPKYKNENISQHKTSSLNSSIEDILHSVKLIKEISSSVCNSETESEDTPQYQNLPIKSSCDPAPRRYNYEQNVIENENVRVLKPIIEQDIETPKFQQNPKDARRSRLKKCDNIISSSRSISEPPKINRNQFSDRSLNRRNYSRLNDPQIPRSKKLQLRESTPEISEDESPLYSNINEQNFKSEPEEPLRKTVQTKISESYRSSSSKKKLGNQNSHNNKEKNVMHINSTKGNDKNSLSKKRSASVQKVDANSVRNSTTPPHNQRNPSNHKNKSLEQNTHRSRLSQRPSIKQIVGEEVYNSQRKKDAKKMLDNDESKMRRRSKSQDQTSLRKEHSAAQRLESNLKNRNNNFTEHKSKERNITEKNLNTSMDRRARRSEYVINYDDKNGTVSSVCKLNSESGTSRRKKTYDKINENPKEHKVKNRTAERKTLRNATPRTSEEHKQYEIS